MRLWLKDSERLPDPLPMKTDDRTAIGAGTALWVVGAVVAVVFWSPLSRDGFGWVVWMMFVGIALGVLGLCYAQVRRSRATRGGKG